MAGTLRTRTALDTLFADNTAGDIGAQDLRDLLWSTWLQPQITTTSSDAAIPAAAGNHYRVDTSGFTADRAFTLPTCSTGDLPIVLEITTGDDTYDLDIQGDTGVTILWDGKSATAAVITQMFCAGEFAKFEAVAANVWRVTNSKLIGGAALSHSATSLSNSSWTNVGLGGSVDWNPGSEGDNVADTITVRRAGLYAILAGVTVDTITDGTKLISRVTKNGGGFLEFARVITGGTDFSGGAGGGIKELAKGDVLRLQAWVGEAGVNSAGGFLSVKFEELT